MGFSNTLPGADTILTKDRSFRWCAKLDRVDYLVNHCILLWRISGLAGVNDGQLPITILKDIKHLAYLLTILHIFDNPVEEIDSTAGLKELFLDRCYLWNGLGHAILGHGGIHRQRVGVRFWNKDQVLSHPFNDRSQQAGIFQPPLDACPALRGQDGEGVIGWIVTVGILGWLGSGRIGGDDSRGGRVGGDGGCSGCGSGGIGRGCRWSSGCGSRGEGGGGVAGLLLGRRPAG